MAIETTTTHLESGHLEGGRPASDGEELEEILCRLVAEVLDLQEIHADDDIFKLHADSLDAMRLTGLVRAELGVELTIQTVFQAPTPRGIARALGAGPNLRPAVRATTRPDPMPLADGQLGLWFLAQLWGPSPTYHLPVALRLHGVVDRAALELAWWDVVERHESLRTVYPEEGGVPFQQVRAPAAARTSLGCGRYPHAELDAVVHDAAQETFSIDTELPARAGLFSAEEVPDEHVLLIVLHHIAADGWSIRPLVRDLMQAYVARLAGSAPAWEPLPVQYADFVIWQRDWLGDAVNPADPMALQLDFWRRALADIPAQAVLPADRPRPEEPTFHGASVPVDIDIEVHQRVVRTAQTAGTTVFMVLQAAFAALFTLRGAGTDVVLGSPVAGREDAGLCDVVGLFVNLVTLRTDVGGNPTFRQLLDRVKRTDLDAYVHQDVPFDRVVEVVNPRRSPGRHPLFQNVLAYQRHRLDPFALPGLRGAATVVPTAVAKFDLALNLDDVPDGEGRQRGIRGDLEYSTELFDRETVERFAADFVRVLDHWTSLPERRLSELAWI